MRELDLQTAFDFSGKTTIVTGATGGIEDHVAYSAAKAGVTGMARVMALEWAPRGVPVNCVRPTVVDTAMGREGWSGERGERARADIPCRRFAQPEEVALGILFPASGAAAITDPPPLRWSGPKYGFWSLREDGHGETTQARRDRREASAG